MNGAYRTQTSLTSPGGLPSSIITGTVIVDSAVHFVGLP